MRLCFSGAGSGGVTRLSRCFWLRDISAVSVKEGPTPTHNAGPRQPRAPRNRHEIRQYA